MKINFSIAGLILALGLAGGASAREFTSADGMKKMSGTITAVSLADRTATIRKSDGNSVTFPMAALQEEDQTFITDWYKASAMGRKLAISIDSAEEKGAESKTSNTKIYSISSQFVMELRNNAKFDFEDVEIRYRMFFTKDMEKGANEDKTLDGVVKVDELLVRGETTISTDSVSLNVQKPLPAQQCAGGT